MAIANTSIDAYISTRKQRHGEGPAPCPRGPLPQTTTVVDRMARKLHTKAGARVHIGITLNHTLPKSPAQ